MCALSLVPRFFVIQLIPLFPPLLPLSPPLAVGGSACLAGSALIRDSSSSWPALAITGLLAVVGALLVGARNFWRLSLSVRVRVCVYLVCEGGQGGN